MIVLKTVVPVVVADVIVVLVVVADAFIVFLLHRMFNLITYFLAG